MIPIKIILGILMLVLGGRFFSLVIGGTGFLVGYILAGLIAPQQPVYIPFLAGVGCAILAAVLATSLKKAAVGVAGFAAGGYLSLNLATLLKPDGGWLVWGLALAGGLLGALLLATLVHIGMILLSSVSGAALIVYGLPLDSRMLAVLFLALVISGMAMQTHGFGAQRRQQNPPSI